MLFAPEPSQLLAPKFFSFTGISPGDRVLDVGCGTGVLSKALADRGLQVIGIDASEGYLEGARKHRSHPNLTFESGDMRRMRFADNSFDAAVSTLALDVVPETEQVVGEMRRVTRPGGIVALREEVKEHVRAGYLLGLPDGPRSFPMMFRAVRGVCPNAS
jgi:ubiquinone/menaquinone biosynthesis C-methylase UbiE